MLWDLRLGSGFQNASTFLKVGLILVIIAAGFYVKETQPVSFLPVDADRALIVSTPFAISLYWVMYAYSGWNASTYIIGEVRNPARAIPLSLGLGTLLVTVLYLGINAVFLRTTPAAEMVGKQEVGLIAGLHIFGNAGGKVMAVFIALGLISTVSAMMWIGPRVTVAMGEDLGALSWLARRNARGIPVRATLVQFAIANLLIFVATFQKVVNYVEFSLTLFSALTVLGVFVLRWRRPELPRPYRTWGYPITPAIFLAVSGWMLWHLLEDPSTREPSLWGLATARLGSFYTTSRRRRRLTRPLIPGEIWKPATRHPCSIPDVRTRGPLCGTASAFKPAVRSRSLLTIPMKSTLISGSSARFLGFCGFTMFSSASALAFSPNRVQRHPFRSQRCLASCTRDARLGYHQSPSGARGSRKSKYTELSCR